MIDPLAQAFPTPALRKVREGRGTRCFADAGQIKSLGHPPPGGSPVFSRRIMGAIALLAAWAALASSALAQFETRATFPVGKDVTPYSLVVGDFDGDGILDLAEVNYLPTGGVKILLANGDGTFRLGATYAVAVQPFYASAASLRGNGILDLVVGDSLSDDVYVMLGNGDGTFESPVPYPTSGRPVDVGTGYFTGSGNLDIIALTGNGAECNCVEVLPGNGDGTFGAAINTPVPYDIDGFAMAAGGFNDNGKLDVAVAGGFSSTSQVDILLGNGDGTFDADGYYAVSASPQSVATGYFANRKKIDLAVANLLGSSLSVLLGNGDGTFQQSVYYDTQFPTWVLAQDLNGDGRVDLTASNWAASGQISGVSVLSGNGNGTFEPGKFYPAGEEINYVAAGDFNGDGKPDLVLVDLDGEAVITLLNTGVVSFSPTTPLNFEKQAVGKTSAPQTVTLTNTGTTELKIQSMKASAEFGMKSTCGDRVAPGGRCTISATFSPTKQGAEQGTISIIDNASSKPQVIELLATGT